MNLKEAKKFLKHVAESQKELANCKTTNFYKKENESIETVLQALEDKDRESHFIQSELDKANAEIIELKEELEAVLTCWVEIEKSEKQLKKQNEEQEKMVDFMIEWIRERSIYGADSSEILKEYFKEKVCDKNETYS